jgi:serine/threonine protein phosphatase 1
LLQLKTWNTKLNLLWQVNDNSYKRTYSIAKGSGRRLVITDIHGCYKTFRQLLDKVSFTKNDQLFILGDMLNRGPYSDKVIDHIKKLIKNDYQIFPLRGNHEQLVLATHRTSPKHLQNYLKKQNSFQLLNPDGFLKNKYFNFLKILPYYYKLDNCYLVHAGFNFDVPEPFKDSRSMLWIRNFTANKTHLLDRFIVHGHDPKSMEEISRAIHFNNPIIPLDNACTQPERVGFGNLLCLNIDTKDLYVQPNIDEQWKTLKK